MAKWKGRIGFAILKETDIDVWTEEIIERSYYGDVVHNTRTTFSGDSEVNQGFNISNKISFIADPYARENMYRMKYATFQGIKWKISNIEVEYPRLTMTFGGIWNGSEPTRIIADI